MAISATHDPEEQREGRSDPPNDKTLTKSSQDSENKKRELKMGNVRGSGPWDHLTLNLLNQGKTQHRKKTTNEMKGNVKYFARKGLGQRLRC